MLYDGRILGISGIMGGLVDQLFVLKPDDDEGALLEKKGTTENEGTSDRDNETAQEGMTLRRVRSASRKTTSANERKSCSAH